MQLDWPLVGRSGDLDRVAVALGNPDCSGVVFIGPGGVGKTRLANECLALAEQTGFSTAKAVATRSTSSIPLGALAPLLPDLGDKAINLLGAAREALAARSGTKPLLLFVDDAHLLDDVSAALLLQIAADQQVFVVVTVRSGEEVSDAITALWKDSHAERIDIEPLADLDLDQLIIEALGGGVDPLARDELLRISEGNPLTLRELIYSALASDTLVEFDGLWKLTGPITVSSRLADLVSERLDALDEASYAALEVLALGEPLGVSTLEQLSSPEAIEVLERKGLLRVYEADRRLEAWLAHPLYGEVVRKRLGRLRARGVLRQLADAVESYGANRRGDLLRIATWRLESGSARNAETLASAARQAYVALDYVLSRRLGEAAWNIDKTVQSGHLLGLVLSELGLCTEAEPVLAAASELAVTDEERVLVAMARSENLFRAERPDEAIAAITDAEGARHRSRVAPRADRSPRHARCSCSATAPRRSSWCARPSRAPPSGRSSRAPSPRSRCSPGTAWATTPWRWPSGPTPPTSRSGSASSSSPTPASTCSGSSWRCRTTVGSTRPRSCSTWRGPGPASSRRSTPRGGWR